MKDVAVHIVNWNGIDFIKDCLDSLQTQTYRDFKVLLIDNGSTDGSLELVQYNYPEIEVVTFDTNTGFAYPHSYAIHHSLQDPNIQYCIPLNNDTKLEPTYIEELVAASKRHPEASSIQGKVVNFYDHSIIDCTGILIHHDMSAMNRGQHEKDTGQFAQEEEIFGVSASAALYTRTSLEAVQLPHDQYFDTDYFAYYEDVDLAWRLRLAGFSSFYTPTAVIYHIHSATGISHSPFKAFHIHRNHYYNMIKNLPLLFLLRALALMPYRYILLLSSVLKKKGPSAALSKKTSKFNMIWIVLKSWRDVIINLPKLLKKRRSIQKQRTVSNSEIASWFKQYHADLKKIIYGER